MLFVTEDVCTGDEDHIKEARWAFSSVAKFTRFLGAFSLLIINEIVPAPCYFTQEKGEKQVNPVSVRCPSK